MGFVFSGLQFALGILSLWALRIQKKRDHL
jgi:hypothetical protein